MVHLTLPMWCILTLPITLKYLKSWKGIIKSLRNEKKFISRVFKEVCLIDKEENMPKLDIISFSDTIILTLSFSLDIINKNEINYKEHSCEMLIFLGSALKENFYKTIMQDKIFLRGVVSYGDFYKMDSFLIGPAIDEAAMWYDKAEWFGISATPSAKYFIEDTGIAEEGDIFIRYPIPMKDGKTTDSYVISWPYFASLSTKVLENIDDIYYESRTQLLESFSSNKVIDKSSYLKYDNTLKFFDDIYKIFCRRLKD